MFPWALPSVTPSGKGVYLTVYPSSCPNTDTIFSPYTAIEKKLFKNRQKKEKEILFNLIKVDRGKGGITNRIKTSLNISP